MKKDAPYVPTPEVVVDAMLLLAGVGKEDVLYDLGCGDGRIVVTAARKHGARGVGVEIDPKLVAESERNARKAGVADRARFLQEDLFKLDFRDATVVTLYLLPELNLKLRPRLLKDLKPGARIVSHDFLMDDWWPDRTVEVQGPTRVHRLHYWIVPTDASGTWRAKAPGSEVETLTLAQRFQEVEGSLRLAGREIPLAEVRLEGDRLTFTAPEAADTPVLRFEGRVSGKELRGKLVRGSGKGKAAKEWVAVRE